MLKKHDIKSYALIVGLATVLFLPITAVADTAVEQAMEEEEEFLNARSEGDKMAPPSDALSTTPSGVPMLVPKLLSGTLNTDRGSEAHILKCVVRGISSASTP